MDLPFEDGVTDRSIFHRGRFLMFQSRNECSSAFRFGGELTQNVIEGWPLPLSTPASILKGCVAERFRSFFEGRVGLNSN